MARKASPADTNKSQAIRDLLQKNPDIKAKEAVDALAAGGVQVTPGLFYFIKGKVQGRKSRGRKQRRQVAGVMETNGAAAAKSDVLATIRKVKALADEVGGMRKLRELVEALG